MEKSKFRIILCTDFEFLIASPFERENLVCEIYYKDEIIAEISHESEEFVLEIYPPQKSEWWTIPLDNFQMALTEAKKHLIGNQ